MAAVLARIWRLARLCAAGRGGRVGIAYFAIVFALNIAATAIKDAAQRHHG